LASDEHPKPPKGARTYHLLAMSDADFEALCSRLVRLEHPTVIRPAAPGDGGADMVLPGPGTTYERCWQVKHFTRAINWTQCRESLDRAKETWRPTRYTFCFPRDLRFKEQETFDKRFRGEREGVAVDHWSGDAILARLTGSEEGERVARTFFNDPELDMAKVVRAVQAQGALETGQDALERMLPVGQSLASSDAYFAYPAATHETGQPGHEPPAGTAMSIIRVDGLVTTRVDAVPRDAEALERYGPEVRVETTPDEKGTRAAELLQSALQHGHSVSLTEGVEVVVTQAPPAFEQLVGERLTAGTLEVGPAEPLARPTPPPPPPYHTRISVETDEGPVSLDVTLLPAETPPPGFDGALVGSYGGLQVSAMFRAVEGGGELKWNFHYTTDESPLRERVAALRLIRALGDSGQAVITDRGPSKRPEIRAATPPVQLPQDLRALVAYLEDLLAISDWTGVEFEVPDFTDGEGAATVARVAKLIRDSGWLVRWSEIELTVGREEMENLSAGQRQLALVRTLAARINNQVVELGFTHVVVTEYQLTVVAEHADGTFAVRLEPPTGDAGEVFERLTKQEPQPGKKRPPPPPRKTSGKRKRRKHGRRR
jgi:hypothetical protein